MSKATARRGSRRRPSERSRAEWVTFGVASAILLAVVAAIASLLVTEKDAPPAFTVETIGVREVDGRFHVTASIENTGDETAEAVQVVAELVVGDAPPEEGEQIIDFLSGGDIADVAFLFSTDPADGELTIDVHSFKVP
jgi:uncharacterized protein (TIGR02588 family)